jgi:hypothetical protein
MRTTAKLLLLSCALPLLLAACSSATAPPPVASVQSVADLAGYRTYAFMPGGAVVARPGGLGDTPADAVDAGIRRAIAATLARKGLVAAASPDRADLVVSYSLGTTRTVTVQQADRVFAPPGDPFFGAGPDPITPWQFELLRIPVTEGTLAVVMADARTGREVWRGHATGRLTRPAPGGRIDRAELVGAVERAATALLDRYPARPGVATAAEWRLRCHRALRDETLFIPRSGIRQTSGPTSSASEAGPSRPGRMRRS